MNEKSAEKDSSKRCELGDRIVEILKEFDRGRTISYLEGKLDESGVRIAGACRKDSRIVKGLGKSRTYRGNDSQ